MTAHIHRVKDVRGIGLGKGIGGDGGGRRERMNAPSATEMVCWIRDLHGEEVAAHEVEGRR